MDFRLPDLVPLRRPGIVGDLRVLPDRPLPGLDRSAEVYVWLPPGYDEGDQRYPVVYLHDGDNMFLDERAFGGVSWGADRALTRLAEDGAPVIAVAVPCHPTLRGDEYTVDRFAEPQGPATGGRAEVYARFLLEELKPAVDAALRTRSGPEDTLTLGSSFGAVISAYLWQTRNDVVGGIGLLSPAWYADQAEALTGLERAVVEDRLRGRVYLDVGGLEAPMTPWVQRQYVRDAERLLGALREARVPVRYLFDSQGYHFEDAWASRLPAALGWLLRGWRAPEPAYVTAALARAATSATDGAAGPAAEQA